MIARRYKVKEIAELWSCDVSAVYRAIRSGELPCVTLFDNTKRIREEDVLAYESRNEEEELCQESQERPQTSRSESGKIADIGKSPTPKTERTSAFLLGQRARQKHNDSLPTS